MSRTSVTPSQSASNIVISNPSGGGPRGVAPVEALLPPDTPFPHLHLIDSVHRPGVIQAYMQAYSLYVGVVSAAAGEDQDCSSVSESEQSVSAVSSTSSKRRRRRRRKRGGSAMSSATSVAPYSIVSGTCYLAMYRPSVRAIAQLEFGTDPAFGDLLRVPVSWYTSVGNMQTLHVSRVSVGMYHLGSSGPTLLETLRALHETFGSLLSLPDYVAKSPLSSDLVDKIKLRDRLGATLWPDLPYGKWLSTLAGHEHDEFPSGVTDLLSRAAALRSPRERDEGKMLEALGDAVLTTTVALKCVEEGRTAEVYQGARSAVTSNPSLSRIFVDKIPQRFVVFPSGVNPGSGKAGAYMLEAILGAIYQRYGQQGVTTACQMLTIFDLYDWSL